MRDVKAIYVVEGEVLPAPPTPARPRLNTVRECRRELAKVYADAKVGRIETQTATRLCYLLTSLAAMIRDGELEDRVRALETQIQQGRK
ncbi:hypothetical protein [Brevundimonas sp.]|uniref:hypothetical protein n=1 Tax=Brevundimonas sp. TaxID=1871086 RepID=UPI003568E5DD